MTGLRVPPGRAGRVWLRERLGLAESALSLLEQKQAILDERLTGLRLRRDRTRADWTSAAAAADVWQARAALLGGQWSLTFAATQPAELTVGTATVAGASYPDTALLSVPEDPPGRATGGTTMAAARAAAVAAVTAAAGHAVAAAAVQVVEQELAATGLRVRALRHRRIPALRTALAELDLVLEERERAERILPGRARAGGVGQEM
ncbi:V-type ATP synthase subunit D [Nocardia sp. alder85J]|uniref:V-type ATP synthase subunit D n=1 Tax=Nocardia sp. alder85J TaxID=2862949 RepID=UPI001CD7E703|nr:V-type ATP synthase subunit D [Nocardia sp. alder85J]MCX4092458.1 V-type ATP synthase subunit D [Nocardia sp. alder85J]